MQKTALTIFGALLNLRIGGPNRSSVRAPPHVTKANFSQRHPANFRGAYNAVRPINVSVTARALDRTDTDFRRADPSWIGDEDPSLHPSD